MNFVTLLRTVSKFPSQKTSPRRKRYRVTRRPKDRTVVDCVWNMMAHA